ncbi:hypothetical protein BGZ82_006326 [Podila clonocystis]|nr:hypothetical protein BGZ82_006326 [Podila clonocystis]
MADSLESHFSTIPCLTTTYSNIKDLFRRIITLHPLKPVPPTRRIAHILSEQKRREKINGGFDELKSVIPECAQNTDSKATILRKAVDYILLLEDELRKYTDQYHSHDPDDDGDHSRTN